MPCRKLGQSTRSRELRENACKVAPHFITLTLGVTTHRRRSRVPGPARPVRVVGGNEHRRCGRQYARLDRNNR